MSNYDENLHENSFLNYLKSSHPNIIRRACDDGWLICVPRSNTITASALTQTYMLKHILVPCSGKETLYKTLTDQTVYVNDGILICLGKDQSESDATPKVKILFSETVYEEQKKYKLICIENELFSAENPMHVSIDTYEDCITLLAHNEQIALKKLKYLSSKFSLNCKTVEESVNECRQFYKKCCNSVKLLPHYKKLIQGDSYFNELLDLAVVSFVQSFISSTVFKCLNKYTAYDDEILNVNICNSSNIMSCDLDIVCDSLLLSKAVQELRNIFYRPSIIGKIEAFEKSTTILSAQFGKFSSDELLPFIVYLVIKSNIRNWNAQLLYLKQFGMSNNGFISAKKDFFTSTIEAALEYIKSGAIFFKKPKQANQCEEDVGYFLKSEIESYWCNENDSNRELFELIKSGDSESLEKLLKDMPSRTKCLPQNNNADNKICHPLCECQICVSTSKHKTTRFENNFLGTIRDDQRRSLLHTACAFGWPKIVKVLLHYKSPVNCVDNLNYTALHHAAQRGNKNCLLLLLHAGAAINLISQSGETALHLAAMRGHAGCVKALLYYAELERIPIHYNGQDLNGDTPLHFACRWGFKECVVALLDTILEHQGELTIKNKLGETIQQCCNNDQLNSLIMKTMNEMQNLKRPVALEVSPGTEKKIYSIETEDSFSNTLNQKNLASDVQFDAGTSKTSDNMMGTKEEEHVEHLEEAIAALTCNDIELAYTHLGIKSIPEEQSCNNSVSKLCHPLCQCSNCHHLTTKVHDSSGSYHLLNTCGSEGKGVLHIAAQKGYLGTVKSLLLAGSQASLTSSPDLKTALHLAVSEGHISVVMLLLEYGSDPNMKDVDGNTPLHLSAMAGHEEVLVQLLKFKADPLICNKLGLTAAELAVKNGYEELSMKIDSSVCL